MATSPSPTAAQPPQEMTVQAPTSQTFSFTAPFPPHTSALLCSPPGHKQQRRVSLALPSSPRIFPEWKFRDDTSLGNLSAALLPEKKGKMRKIFTEDDDTSQAQVSPSMTTASQLPSMQKKQRKKWSPEETGMLVHGCNKWGVGNWKAILNDPELVFDDRSPVDLKDRFRTYYPDAYRQHYPNAKTHLSSKVRSALPDGSSIFEKTRSKKRRPFTEEEDRALKAGYDKHGTVWATIVKDPIFQEQNRRSTDLRDRFRNAFPELYQAAGYKPRMSAKKKKALGWDVSMPETSFSTTSEFTRKPKSRVHPVRAATDDLAMGRDGLGPVRRKRRNTTQGLFRGGTKSVPESTHNSEGEESGSEEGEEDRNTPPTPAADITTPNSTQPPTEELYNDTNEVDMDIQPLDQLSDHLSIPDFMSGDVTESSQTTAWSSLDTPLNSWTSAPRPATSPSPTHDYLLPHSPIIPVAHTMIGNSAWGPQDWLSANPRLDGSRATSSHNSFIGGSAAFSPHTHPSSPTSFSSSSNGHPLSSLSHASLNHLQSQQFNHHSQFTQSHSQGVFDRYDLFPNSLSHDIDFDLDFISEGFGGETTDEQSAFSDPSAWANTGSGMRGGFTHHSNYAGDLIFGARTHQPSGHMMDYGHGFGFGSGSNNMDIGLGLEGVQSGSQPKSGLHTPALPGIDEIELTGISLDDHEFDADIDVLSGRMDESDSPDSKDHLSYPQPLALEDLVGLPLSDDESGLCDGEESEMTVAAPPSTPYTGMRSSGRASVPGMHTPYGGHSHHNRSVSVPPSEHRNSDPRPEHAHSRTPNPQRKYKPLPTTSTAVRPTFQPFQLPTSMPPPAITPVQKQAILRPHLPPQVASFSSAGASSSSSPPYKVPYLDLHYYTNMSPGVAFPVTYPKSHFQGHAQALDLAQSVAQQAQSSSKPLCVSPSSLMQFNTPFSGTASASVPHSGSTTMRHQRGLSAVSPQDLLVRRGSDNNKRKRASWDGGVS